MRWRSVHRLCMRRLPDAQSPDRIRNPHEPASSCVLHDAHWHRSCDRQRNGPDVGTDSGASRRLFDRGCALQLVATGRLGLAPSHAPRVGVFDRLERVSVDRWRIVPWHACRFLLDIIAGCRRPGRCMAHKFQRRHRRQLLRKSEQSLERPLRARCPGGSTLLSITVSFRPEISSMTISPSSHGSAPWIPTSIAGILRGPSAGTCPVVHFVCRR